MPVLVQIRQITPTKSFHVWRWGMRLICNMQMRSGGGICLWKARFHYVNMKWFTCASPECFTVTIQYLCTLFQISIYIYSSIDTVHSLDTMCVCLCLWAYVCAFAWARVCVCAYVYICVFHIYRSGKGERKGGRSNLWLWWWRKSI